MSKKHERTRNAHEYERNRNGANTKKKTKKEYWATFDLVSDSDVEHRGHATRWPDEYLELVRREGAPVGRVLAGDDGQRVRVGLFGVDARRTPRYLQSQTPKHRCFVIIPFRHRCPSSTTTISRIPNLITQASILSDTYTVPEVAFLKECQDNVLFMEHGVKSSENEVILYKKNQPGVSMG